METGSSKRDLEGYAASSIRRTTLHYSSVVQLMQPGVTTPGMLSHCMHLVQLALHNASHLSTRSGQQQIAFARAASCDSVQNSVSPQNDVEQQQPDTE